MPAKREHAATIAAALKKHGRMSALEISQTTQIPMQKVAGALGQMARRRMARPVARQPGPNGKAIWAAYEARPVDPRLPMFVEAKGVVHEDCRGYAGCLDRFVRQAWGQTEASCPVGCKHFVVVTRTEKMHEAMLGAPHPLGGGW
jgi:hypothetical protein